MSPLTLSHFDVEAVGFFPHSSLKGDLCNKLNRLPGGFQLFISSIYT